MTTAFYAPLKSPDDPTPSGDRQIARNLVTALEQADAQPSIASTLRTFERIGDKTEQASIRDQATKVATQLLASYASREKTTPDIWLTYHSYHRAPDWIGPTVASALAIPYVLVEASVSPKQEKGLWSLGHNQACHAARTADLILGLNPRDAECVRPYMKPSATYAHLPAFIDTQTISAETPQATTHRANLKIKYGIAEEATLLIAVGMMRQGDKATSYMQLAQTLDRLTSSNWHLLVVGDGPAREQVVSKFTQHANRTTWLGAQSQDALAALYAAADILVWPAVNEALGMTFLEAAACGIPSVAGYTDGVASLIEDGLTGWIAPSANLAMLATHLDTLLGNPTLIATMGAAAKARVNETHSLKAAARALREHLSNLKENVPDKADALQAGATDP